MRITPLICWQCSHWFVPTYRRPTKFCCANCRVQHHRNNKVTVGYKNLVSFRYNTAEEKQEIADALSESCKKDDCSACVECLYENDYPKYLKIVYLYGEDWLGVGCQEYLKKTGKSTLI